MINLAEESICTGCALCHDICRKNAITMCANEEGFQYPHIDSDKCIECGMCQRMCPVMNDNEFHESKKAYYGRVMDNIEANSSGGLCKALIGAVLKEEGVVFGAVLNHDEVFHIKGTTEKQCNQMSGSKYLQSNMEGIYKQIEEELNRNKKVLFIGCPCQCGAVKLYFKHTNNLYVCEILCHGVPSPGLFKGYIAFLEKKYKSEIVSYSFRSKTNGWSRPSVEIVFKNGKRVTQRHNESVYHMWFGKHLSLRPSCFECKFRNKKRVADITLGDFWGISELNIDDKEIERGTSVCVVNTENGSQLLDMARNVSNIFLEEIPIDNAYIKNEPSLHNFKKPEEREQFFHIYNQGSIKELIKEYPAENKMISLLRKFKYILINR